ncbi:MAG TPA: 4-hydroxythreonine-4-phosphate dehydrogenase PdxA [Vicinamibacterales bacterium]|nr:4-hydroxythreonine-4-phosphate dehydrogenase PdxA [Vicinamibacterales bacterium]
MSAALPVVAITAGDPSGIGPEIALKASTHPRVVAACTPRLYGPTTATAIASFPAGVVDAASARAAHAAIVGAVEDARAGRVAAVVTAPINKEAFALAGFPWPGHTELFAHLCGVEHVAMMFWSEPLRVVLATVHVPLKDVPSVLSAEVLGRTIRLTAASLPRFGFSQPRIGVAGLNPHAGEHGLIGSEEERVFVPVIAQCRQEGINVAGPYPADTLFVRAMKGEFDVVIAAYHDQGLVPVKLAAFGKAVNVTLGLPIIRTSVDHGTAFDIARKGIADEGSLVEAVLLAARLAGAEAPADGRT